MPPPLPTELLNEILSLENAEANAVERQLNRQRFGRVCRDWYNSVDWWKELAVTSTAGLCSLVSTLEGDEQVELPSRRVGCRIRSAFVKTGFVPADQDKLAILFRRAINTRCVELVNSHSDLKVLAATVVAPLASLDALKELTLRGLDVQLQASAGWPALESLSAHGGALRVRRDPQPVHQPPRRPPAPIGAPLKYLPAWAHPRREIIRQAAAAASPPPPAPPVPQPAPTPLAYELGALGLLAARLTQLALLGAPVDAPAYGWPPMPRVRSLSLDVADAARLPGRAAILAGLETLALSGGRASLAFWDLQLVTSGLEHAVKVYSGLKRVEVDRVSWEAGTPERRERVEAAAARHFVKLVIA